MFANLNKRPLKIGMFLKDKVDGDISQKAMDYIQKSPHQKVELKDFMDIVNSVKLEREIENIKTASTLC